MKTIAFLSAGLALALNTSVYAQAQVTPYDTIPDYHNWIVPVGVGAGAVHRSVHLVPQMGQSSPLQSRPISGMDAAKIGDAHWANTAPDCFKLGKRINKKPKRILDAKGGGVWCIFPGEQTNFGG